MKMYSRSLAGLIILGLGVTGCSQQQGSPVVEAAPEPAPTVNYYSQEETVVVPAPAPVIQPMPAPVIVRPAPPKPRPVAPRKRVVVPSVKAKGTYHGPVDIDENLVEQYKY